MEKRLKVLWVCSDWPREGMHGGGVGRYVYRLAAEVRDAIDLSVVAAEDAIPLDGVRLVPLPKPRTRFHRYYVAAWQIRQAVEREQPELVHGHGDDWLVPGGVSHVRSFYGTSWSEARTSKGVRRLNHVVLAGAEHLTARRADAKLAIAPESVAAFKCELIVPPFLRRSAVPAREPSYDPTVLFLGSYEGRKRGRVAARATEAAGRLLGRSVRLVVIGPSEDRRNWPDGVTHLAGLSDGEVSRELATAWCLLSPSSYEGFGIPLVEGLEHGLSVVASENPGSRFVRSCGGPHLPLRVCDDDELADALASRLQKGPTLSQAESAAAEALVAEMTTQGAAQRLLEVYRGVVAASESRGGPRSK